MIVRRLRGGGKASLSYQVIYNSWIMVLVQMTAIHTHCIESTTVDGCLFIGNLSSKTCLYGLTTQYNQIEHSTRIRHIRDGQREGLLRMKCVIFESKIEKVPRGIRGEKSSKDMASSRNLVSTIGALASPKMGDGTRCPEG